MTFLEFLPFENYHIRFKLEDGTELSGVLVGSINALEERINQTSYDFIPTRNMIDWKQAEQKNDKEQMKSLQGKIDITNIVWVERLKY